MSSQRTLSPERDRSSSMANKALPLPSSPIVFSTQTLWPSESRAEQQERYQNKAAAHSLGLYVTRRVFLSAFMCYTHTLTFLSLSSYQLFSLSFSSLCFYAHFLASYDRKSVHFLSPVTSPRLKQGLLGFLSYVC